MLTIVRKTILVYFVFLLCDLCQTKFYFDIFSNCYELRSDLTI